MSKTHVNYLNYKFMSGRIGNAVAYSVPKDPGSNPAYYTLLISSAHLHVQVALRGTDL